MRLIARFQKKQDAEKFSFYLRKMNISNFLEEEKNESIDFLVWVNEEDQISEAKKYLEEFEKDSENKKYLNPPPFPKRKIPKNFTILNPKRKETKTYIITLFFVVVCVCVYFINFMQEVNEAKEKVKPSVILTTPIQLALLFDTPVTLIELTKIFENYSIKSTASFEDLPVDIQNKIRDLDKIPQWKGIYFLILQRLQNKVKITGPMFVKIKQGEIWRFFTPCILHKDVLHILFNMLWLWVLGKQLEEKVSKGKLVLFILIIGVVSNVAQYLMGGPLFLGFSGVIMGMAGFIWMRQKVAPWEGYVVRSSTFLFLGVFVFAMVALQIASFLVQSFGGDFLSINIANTAHISGGMAGIVLGKSSYFSWRPVEY